MPPRARDTPKRNSKKPSKEVLRNPEDKALQKPPKSGPKKAPLDRRNRVQKYTGRKLAKTARRKKSDNQDVFEKSDERAVGDPANGYAAHNVPVAEYQLLDNLPSVAGSLKNVLLKRYITKPDKHQQGIGRETFPNDDCGSIGQSIELKVGNEEQCTVYSDKSDLDSQTAVDTGEDFVKYNQRKLYIKKLLTRIDVDGSLKEINSPVRIARPHDVTASAMDDYDIDMFRLKAIRWKERDIHEYVTQKHGYRFQQKTIGTRYCRMKKAIQKHTDEMLEQGLAFWHEGDDPSLRAAKEQVDVEVGKFLHDLEALKWELTADRLKMLKPVTNFSAEACKRRIEELGCDLNAATIDSPRHPMHGTINANHAISHRQKEEEILKSLAKHRPR
ncbi:hypothetical protein ASPZODRAFT_27569 [Penicilliopsis zonata CBS 506.65]|uniref:DUF7626 domain-containing protein n=1 Tax=Penicilliopsis zonata CBS 506.65 TaxID=1073090 RepID=A0A1L9SAV5_9EURO|nr:hypothetical protein ASPZODRAFT_27569 [Penicilliopsis zonata CBS 506.65]OJJ44313.1 hypothetical protein ASPZODRAFT_27569 [Penicilliopsis zonata CBS 506.65]